MDTRLAGHDTRFTTLGQGVTTLTEGFEGFNERLDLVDDHVEAVNQRVGQLPALLEVGEVHKRVAGLISAQTDAQGERFDTLTERLAETVPALRDLIQSRPDQAQLSKILDDLLSPTHADMTRHLTALEETMLALAEALLRPTRPPKD
jgi:hypothetical protein